MRFRAAGGETPETKWKRRVRVDSTHHDKLTAGLAAHEAGDFVLAESKYREVLEADPENGDANHALGLLMIGLDKPSLSLDFLRAALRARPDRPHLWLDYLQALVSEQRLPEAWELLGRAREQAINTNQLDRVESEILAAVAEHNVTVKSASEQQASAFSS